MHAHNLQIRSVEPADFGALQALHAQPKVIHGTMQLPFPSQELWRKRCAERADSMQVLVACSQHELVGCAALNTPTNARRRHVGELGMAVHDAWHRRGVGAALLGSVLHLADRWLNLSRIELTVYTDNTPAISLYEKFGFVREGRLVRYAFRDGEYTDAFAMARLRGNRALQKNNCLSISFPC